MLKSHYTTTELESMQLPSLPKTRRGLDNLAKREVWASRKRNKSGGGLEYDISSLSEDVRIAIVGHIVGTGSLSKFQDQSRHMRIKEERGRAKFTEEERRSAKLVIVKMYDLFRETSGLGKTAAEVPFIELYQKEFRHNSEDYFPLWVFEIYKKFSVQTLRNWRKLDFAKLGGKYGNRKGAGVIDRAEGGEVSNYIASLIVEKPHLTGGHFRELTIAKFGDSLKVLNSRSGQIEEKEVPNIRTFERYISKWKHDNADVYKSLRNPDAYKNHNQIAIGRMDAGVDRLNQMWEIDATPSDVLTTEGRKNIYGMLDVYSRRAIFLITDTANTDGSLALVRKAILEWGVPEAIKTDNGADFVSKRFVGALQALKIRQDICPPYSGEKKPFVERVFKTLQHDLMPLLDGYIGHNVAERKEIQARYDFSERLGQKDVDAFNVKLTPEDLAKLIDRWAVEKYEHRKHGTLGCSPYKKAAQWSEPVSRIQNERALDILLSDVAGQDGSRTVGKKGIKVTGGFFYGAGLEIYMSKKVFVRHDPTDMGRVYVYDDLGEFICEAINHERLNVDPTEAAILAKKKQRQHVADMRKELMRGKRKITKENVAEQYLSRSAKNKEKLVSFPAPSQDYSTSALDEAVKSMDRFEIDQVADKSEDHQRFEAEFIELQNHRPDQNLSDEDIWWNRYQKLLLEKKQGGALSPENKGWMRLAEGQYWFTSRMQMQGVDAESVK